jgi:DNA-binding PadR family transcriptional regulator
VHSELERRTDRVGRVNVGQIYSTLDRLVLAGLVRASGTTDDGSPLYGLTADGQAAAEEWLDSASLDGADPWGDMTFKVMLAASLGHPGTPQLVERYRAAWASMPGDGFVAEPGRMARARLAQAALAWLDDLGSLPGGVPALARPLRNERPRRGRRPSPPQ